jgi:hypothetical protein
MLMNPEQSKWFNTIREEWLRVMKPITGHGVGALFPPLLHLPPENLDGCVVLSQREEILRRLPVGGICAEIGTQDGFFAEEILSIVRPDKLHLFDLDDRPIREKNPNIVVRPDIELHIGDSSTMLSAFHDDHFDWIYVGGDHSYDGVQKDIQVAKTKVKPGALLIFNAFTLWSPAELIDYGVPYAVCELSVNFGFKFVYFALHPHLYNDVALRRPLVTGGAA